MFVPYTCYTYCVDFFKIHCQCTVSRLSVCFGLTVSLSRRAPDNRAIVGRWSTLPPTVCRPSIDSQVAQLSVDCQLTLHQQSTNGRPMVNRLSIKTWLTVHRQSIDRRSTLDRWSINSQSTVYYWQLKYTWSYLSLGYISCDIHWFAKHNGCACE